MSPQVGWICVFNNEEKSFADCIACSKTASHCEYLPEMLILMKRQSGSKPIKPEEPSVTQILAKCLRSKMISVFFDYYVSPRRNWYMFRGNLVHGVLEGIPSRDAWKEITQVRDVEIAPGVIVSLSGRVDKLVPSKELITDYKTTTKVPMRDEPYGGHGLQLNVYRWIWDPVLKITKLRLQYIDMRQTKQVKVPLMSLEEVEKLVIEKTRNYVFCMQTQTIPEGKYDSKQWECKYCDVTSICEELNGYEEQTTKRRVRKTISKSKPNP